MAEHLDLNEAKFDELLKNEKFVLVDFWAAWCGPCKMLAPVMDTVAADYAGKVTVAKVNIDDEQKLAARYGIQSIPTVILFKDGQPIGKEVGVQPAMAFSKMIDAGLAI
jgi:thioredoxin 1